MRGVNVDRCANPVTLHLAVPNQVPMCGLSGMGGLYLLIES